MTDNSRMHPRIEAQREADTERTDSCAACGCCPPGFGHFALYCPTCAELPYGQAHSDTPELVQVRQLAAGDIVELRDPLTLEPATYKLTGAYLQGEHVELGVLQLHHQRRHVVRRWIKADAIVRRTVQG